MGVGKAAKDKASANVLAMDPFDYPSAPSLRRLTSSSFGPPREAPNPALKSLGTPHIESFNFMLGEGLTMAVNDIPPLEFVIPQPDSEGVRVSISVTKAVIEAPKVPFNPTSRKFDERVFPTETRQRGISYKGNLTIRY
jgi:DNA-directed RNA polymerase I subunit RPA2